MSRPRIRVKHGNEYLTSHSGLVHVGTLLEATGLKERLEDLDIHCDGPTYTHSDIAFSMMGLISIGKPDYDAIEQFREKPQFFVDALGLSACPSSPTLRQRMDLMAVEQTNGLLKQESASLVWRKAPAISALETSVGQFVPLDIDVSPFDNSKTNKEGVSRTYKGYDGYAPIFAYLGTEGYLVNLEFREGKQHCQKNTPEFVRSTLNYARAITQAPILMRLDSGNDSQDNFPGPEYPNVSFIIKRNLRRESLWAWAKLAKEVGQEMPCRDGKRVWIGKTSFGIKGEELPYPIVFEVTERTIKKAQMLAIPEIEVDTYWVSLEGLEPQEVIALYHDHGTSEQFHSELKTDLDLERLPSGCFSTNELVLHLGMLVYNMLRIIGQQSLEEVDASQALPRPRQKKVKRRRVRTVMHDLIYMAGRMIRTGRRWFISFGQMNPFAELWERLDHRLRMAPDSG
jgi:hypothetical protein